LLPDNRRQALGGVGFHHARQEVESRFVRENQHPALAPRPPLQFRPDVVPPALDGCFVPLDRPADGHLGGPLQFLEQPADMVLVVADADLLLDDAGHAGTGPDLAPEAIRLRPMPEKLGDQTLLSGREVGRGPAMGASAQGIGPAVADLSEPTADADRGGAESLGDVLARPALTLQVQRSKPPPLKPIRGKEIRDLHTAILSGSRVTLTAQRSVVAEPLFSTGIRHAPSPPV